MDPLSALMRNKLLLVKRQRAAEAEALLAEQHKSLAYLNSKREQGEEDNEGIIRGRDGR